MSILNLNYYVPNHKKEKKRIEHDVIIYGATVAGISAAVQFSRYGYTVGIVELGRHIGGMTTSGLSATDLGNEKAVCGLAKEFYQAIQSYYDTKDSYNFEPHIAAMIIDDWLDDNNIFLYLDNPLDSVEMVDRKITSIITKKENIFFGKVFLDCSYEGDLLNQAGVSNRIGREYNHEYKEIYNGIQFKEQHHKFEEWVDPYVEERNPASGLLYGIQDIPKEKWGYNGKGDQSIQAYNFRICLTTSEENKVPFPKPTDYDPSKYELLLRYIKLGHWDSMNLLTPLPNEKYDLNNFGAFSTDAIGINHSFPDDNYTDRERIYQEHVNYNLGMLYFLTNDKRVPLYIRDYVSQFGLPKDEFVETGHWPPQLYIRESRRMISDYVMIDRNCLGQRIAEDSIALASYHMDSHNCRRLVVDGRVMNEGDVQIPVSPFGISYRSIRPKKEECDNLLVPVCLSSSHIAFGAIRMEPVFIILGQSAAAAAKLAIENNSSVQDVNYEELKEELEQLNQVVEWDPSWVDRSEERMVSTFGKMN